MKKNIVAAPFRVRILFKRQRRLSMPHRQIRHASSAGCRRGGNPAAAKNVNRGKVCILPLHILNKIKKYPKFYQKVWIACAKVMPGNTITYGGLAKQIGHPNAARAVGTALSKNPFAPIVPCHRVIRSDGKPGGYSGPGGVKKKMRLLRIESKRARE